jgi:hypothetical protein
MSDSIPVWAAITLPLVGFAAALATEFLRGSQTLKRDREARLENRVSERQNARDSFERETLLELQESIAALMRNTAAIRHQTEIEFATHGTWGRRQLPEGIGGESAVSLVRDFQKLRVRVLDDDLRQLATEWWESSAKSTIGAMREEPDKQARQRATDAWRTCVELHEQLNEKLGKRLRNLVSHWSEP